MTQHAPPSLLLVEDNPDTQTLLRHLLQSKFKLAVVATVDEALKVAEQETFDLFILDINLGEHRSGLELLHQFRTGSRTASTPAIALTAYAMPGDRARFLEAGFEAYLSKPFTRQDLLDTIGSVLHTP